MPDASDRQEGRESNNRTCVGSHLVPLVCKKDSPAPSWVATAHTEMPLLPSAVPGVREKKGPPFTHRQSKRSCAKEEKTKSERNRYTRQLQMRARCLYHVVESVSVHPVAYVHLDELGTVIGAGGGFALFGSQQLSGYRQWMLLSCIQTHALGGA